MPMSKQKSKRMGKSAFYSRKYNKWFKSYEGFKTYDKNQKKTFYYKSASRLVYNKRRQAVYDPETRKWFKPRKE